MKYKVFITATFLTLFTAFAQTTAPTRIQGTVTAVDATAKHVAVKTDAGDTVTLNVTARSFIKHLPPGETDSKKVVDMPLAEVGVGDRVVATTYPSADQKTTEAKTILVMTKSDVASIHDKELEDWKKRGTTANVTATDPGSKTFTLKAGAKDVKVMPGDKTVFQRYSPDSAKMADAKPSSFADLKVGDEVHVLGNKNADGTEIQAEQVISGSFPQIAATIKTINAATGEVTVTDLATKKPVTIRFISDSTLKKLPDTVAQMLARRYGAARGGAGADGGGRRGGGGGAPGGGAPGGGRGPAVGGGRGGDVGQMLEQAPAITLADLKPGDAIMVKTTLGRSGGMGTAVVLLAGVEPILTAAPNATNDMMASWNLGGGGGAGGDGN